MAIASMTDNFAARAALRSGLVASSASASGAASFGAARIGDAPSRAKVNVRVIRHLRFMGPPLPSPKQHGLRPTEADCEVGSSPPVVLLHGFPETNYAWRYQIPVLARHY